MTMYFGQGVHPLRDSVASSVKWDYSQLHCGLDDLTYKMSLV